MDFVYCPNGHANRPGTRICAVCRALVEQRAPQSAAAPTSRRHSAPLPPTGKPETAPSPEAAPVDTSPDKKKSRAWVWLLLLLCLLGLLALAVLASFYLPNRTQVQQPTPVTRSTAAAVAINPTDPPLPTPTLATLPTPTGSVAEPSPTAVSTITPIGTVVGVVITPTFPFSPDSNMLQNGDFADNWANGWASEASGEANLIELRAMEDESGTNELHMEQTGSGHLQIAQRVVLTYPVELLEFQARVRAAGTAADGRGALILLYEDFNGKPIGASIWLDSKAGSTELLEALLSLPSGIPVAGRILDEGWQDLTIDLGQEFAEELTGLSPIDVAQLTVILAVVNSDNCKSGACAATLDAAALSLIPRKP